MNNHACACNCGIVRFLLAPILLVSVPVSAQTSEFDSSKSDSGVRYLSVSSKTPRGLKDVEAQFARPQQEDRLLFVEGLKQANTAIFSTDPHGRVEDIALRWRSQLGNDFTVSVLPDHYGRLITPRVTLPYGDRQAEHVRMLRAAFPQARLQAISLSTSDAVANYLLRADASATGDLPVQPIQSTPRPSIEIPVDGITYRVRAESLGGEGQTISGAVRDPSDKIVGYATISLSTLRPGLKFSIGHSEFVAVPLDPSNDAVAAGDSPGAAVLVEKTVAELPDHDGEGPSAAEPMVADPDGAASATSSNTGDAPAVPPQMNTVRMVVGYTAKALEFLRPLPGSVNVQIRSAVKSTNDAFLYHAIPVQFEVKDGGIVAVPYVERSATDAACCGVAPIMLDKQALRERTGDLATLEALRLSLEADVVVLIELVQPNAAGGISCGESGAIAATRPFDAIAVVNVGCLDSMLSFSLTHELGHLLGARHDKASIPPEGTPPPTHHAYGFVSTSPLVWRDVMSLPTSCNWCNRIPHFSDRRCLAKMPSGNCYPSGTDNENAVALMTLQATVLATVFERSLHAVSPVPAGH